MAEVLYVSPFVPAEWIAAHGFVPRRIQPPRPAGAGGVAGVCPFVRAFLEAADGALRAGGRAIVATTTCDQMRRGVELLSPVGAHPDLFLMNVPHTWKTAAAHGLYVDELRRLGRFLEGRGGEAPTAERLADRMRRFDEARAGLRAARDHLDGRAYAERLDRFFDAGQPTVEDAPAGPPRTDGVPVALLGGPLRREDLALYDLVSAAGGRVVLDATETGERALPAPFDRRRLAEDPFLELADAYFGAIPDAFRRPNSELYRYLRREFEARHVRGIVLVRCVWCDLWHAETARLREWTELPLVEVDLTETAGLRRAETRIQTLLELAR